MEETPLYTHHSLDKKDSRYPDKLKIYEDMPSTLYMIGNLPDPKKPSAAIVGARACSPYGRLQAFRYARILSENGVQIISGMAYGIDTEAHKGALKGGTPTFAVLGGGADVCYPPRNRPLYQNILKNSGGILSEQPPGTEVRNYFFPRRNRIISALSDLVLIVEAREKSGSLITAGWALEQGKTVYAIPGPVTEDLSRGCNRLIFDGAGIAYTPEVLLEALGLSARAEDKKAKRNRPEMTADQNLVCSCLDLGPKSIDFVIRSTGLPAEAVSNLLLELKFAGVVYEVSRHQYILNADAPS